MLPLLVNRLDNENLFIKKGFLNLTTYIYNLFLMPQNSINTFIFLIMRKNKG